jgi:AraC family transcriptional regulator
MLIEHQQANSLWTAFPMQQGDLILRPGGSVSQEVRWRSLSIEPMQTLQIHLKSELFLRTAEEMTDRDPTHLTLYGRPNFQDPLLVQIGLALQRELEQPTATSKLYAQTATQMLVVHLLRYYTTPGQQIKESVPGLTSRQVNLVTDFVRANIDQDLSLSMLAQQIGLSPYHFARQFHRATGQSPHQYVLSQRIEQARQLLREADLPLSQIALVSGFTDQSHLTQTFKRSLGYTPAMYREEQRNRARF